MFHHDPASSGSSCRLTCGIGPRDERPGVRVACRFAGEVPGLELLEGGVDVVGVEQYVGRDLVVGVDLDNADTRYGRTRASRATDK